MSNIEYFRVEVEVNTTFDTDADDVLIEKLKAYDLDGTIQRHYLQTDGSLLTIECEATHEGLSKLIAGMNAFVDFKHIQTIKATRIKPPFRG